MRDRAYTVQEIDDLRECCRNMYLWGSYLVPRPGPGLTVSRSYKEHELRPVVEEMVRTHMLAGHTAQDLLAEQAA